MPRLRFTKQQREYQEQVLKAYGLRDTFAPSKNLISEIAADNVFWRDHSRTMTAQRDATENKLAALKDRGFWRTVADWFNGR